MQRMSFLLVLGLGVPAIGASQPPVPDFSVAEVSAVRSILDNMQRAVEADYYPRSKVGKEFEARCQETSRLLGSARSLNEAYALIADALASLDPRIRFYPPARTAWADYSWRWRLIGNAAYVTQVDHVGDAARQGLHLGDRILTLEGLPLDRGSYQQLHYTLNTLAPSPGLLVRVQSPGAEARELAIAATIRPQRKLRQFNYGGLIHLERALSETDAKYRDEFFDVKSHVRRLGGVGIWKPEELHRDPLAVAQGLKLLQGSEALVLDLRGKYLSQYDNVERLLNGLFSRDFEVGIIEESGLGTPLRVRGQKDAFLGVVVVLIDSETAAFAEVFARVIQQQQRGVVMGDRTMGRVLEERVAREEIRGSGLGVRDRVETSNFNSACVLFPIGEVVLAGGTRLDGRGVIPDYLLLPEPADLAAHRDIVLARALALLKQKMSPEDAYKMFPHHEDEDDEY